MATHFSTDSSDFMSKNEVHIEKNELLSDEKMEEYYELSRCANWVTENDYERIALQFPDDFLVYSFRLSLWLQKKSGRNFYVLGDTSYGSCCVDEIAAEHVSSDAIIHFGRTCLSTTTRLPVLYILGRGHINAENVLEECQALCEPKSNSIILFYDVIYHHAIDKISSLLTSDFKSVVVSKLNFPPSSGNANSNNNNVVNSNAIITCGRTIELPVDQSIADFKMLYIGEESLTQANLCLTFQSNRFMSYSPSKETAVWDSINTNRVLKRRYYLVEKAKDAKIIGILVGTLGVKDYLSVISHLKNLIKLAGKRSYTIAVGKPNPPKLANFAEIDIYVLVACAESSLLDCSEFYRPIITPFELEIALNRAREWDGRYLTDFTELIEGGKNYIPLQEWKEEEPDVSLISGGMRSFGISKEKEEMSSSQALEIRNDMKIGIIHSDGAGSHLVERSWKGLEQKLGETEVSDVVEGRRGIAASYENEPE